LVNCRVVHLVDPHFGPENARHRKVLEALMCVLADNQVVPEVVRVHCLGKSTLQFFEMEAMKMAARLPSGVTVDFVRWKQKEGGDLLHNRYVLTDLGGVSLGVGLDAGDMGETDDIHLLTRDQYALRWSQYVGDGAAFVTVDTPKTVVGSMVRRIDRSGRRQA
ncbi:MAG: hypothetical protein IT456_26745, partial [Planctomycetes bacterium]|nr:hypothetical protein [Planctomycetota bacterium]